MVPMSDETDWADREAARLVATVRDGVDVIEFEKAIAESLRRAPTTAFIEWQESWRKEVKSILDEADSRRKSRENGDAHPDKA